MRNLKSKTEYRLNPHQKHFDLAQWRFSCQKKAWSPFVLRASFIFLNGAFAVFQTLFMMDKRPMAAFLRCSMPQDWNLPHWSSCRPAWFQNWLLPVFILYVRKRLACRPFLHSPSCTRPKGGRAWYTCYFDWTGRWWGDAGEQTSV